MRIKEIELLIILAINEARSFLIWNRLNGGQEAGWWKREEEKEEEEEGEERKNSLRIL